jgi:hypothetical protein
MSKKMYAIKLNNVESCAEALDKRIKGGIAVLGMGDEEEVRRELEAVLEGLEGVVKLEEDEKEEWELFGIEDIVMEVRDYIYRQITDDEYAMHELADGMAATLHENVKGNRAEVYILYKNGENEEEVAVLEGPVPSGEGEDDYAGWLYDDAYDAIYKWYMDTLKNKKTFADLYALTYEVYTVSQV